MAEPNGGANSKAAAMSTCRGAPEDSEPRESLRDAIVSSTRPEHRPSALGRFRVRLRRMFYGHRPSAVAFQIGPLALDLEHFDVAWNRAF
jgi:hypothetical protein